MKMFTPNASVIQWQATQGHPFLTGWFGERTRGFTFLSGCVFSRDKWCLCLCTFFRVVFAWEISLFYIAIHPSLQPSHQRHPLSRATKGRSVAASVASSVAPLVPESDVDRLGPPLGTPDPKPIGKEGGEREVSHPGLF